MSSGLFIPKKIKVGFQKRDDTYAQRLAYIIYYDAKGVLRKEKSWETWRDEKIEPEEYSNEPTEGFVLNKGIRRFGWSHFGSNRSYIRVYDPRGIEFEITPENLIGILMDAGCDKRELHGKFVYAWLGDRLVLLPCGSEDYQKACEFTTRQGLDIPAKELNEGCSYTTKKGEEVIYLGRFLWYEWDKGNRVHKKVYLFANTNLKEKKHEWDDDKLLFMPKSDLKFLASLNSPDPVSNYAELIDKFNGDIHSSKIVRWEHKPLKDPDITTQEEGPHPYVTRCLYTEVEGDKVLFWRLQANCSRHGHGEGFDLNDFILSCSSVFNMKTEGKDYDDPRAHRWGDREKVLTREQALDRIRKFSDVYIVLESGKKVRFDKVFPYG